jgi:hypothetical protein
MTTSSPPTGAGTASDERIIGARTPRPKVLPTHKGWRAVGWFGLLLAVIGFADMSLYLIPPGFGSTEWTFGTMARLLISLPLPTIGVAAVVGALLVNRARPAMIGAASVVLLLGLGIAVAYVLFLTTVPLALQGAEGPQALVIVRTIARTSFMGVGFGLAYLVAGIVLFRHLPTRSVS